MREGRLLQVGPNLVGMLGPNYGSKINVNREIFGVRGGSSGNNLAQLTPSDPSKGGEQIETRIASLREFEISRNHRRSCNGGWTRRIKILLLYVQPDPLLCCHSHGSCHHP